MRELTPFIKQMRPTAQGEFQRMYAAGAEQFTMSKTKNSVTFKENGSGTTLQALQSGKGDPRFLLALANTLDKQGIKIDATIADLKNEIAALTFRSALLCRTRRI